MFDKKGTPSDTISVLKEDGTVSRFCGGCKSMTDDRKLDRKAFAEECAECPQGRGCAKCGRGLD